MTPKQKIGRSMREIRDSLNNLDKLVKMNVRLKNELNVDSRSYWKNTQLNERLVKLERTRSVNYSRFMLLKIKRNPIWILFF